MKLLKFLAPCAGYVTCRVRLIGEEYETTVPADVPMLSRSAYGSNASVVGNGMESYGTGGSGGMSCKAVYADMVRGMPKPILRGWLDGGSIVGTLTVQSCSIWVLVRNRSTIRVPELHVKTGV